MLGGHFLIIIIFVLNIVNKKILMKYFTRIFYLPQLWGYYLIKFYIRRSAGLDILHGPRTTVHEQEI